MLATDLVKQISDNIIMIADDDSGYVRKFLKISKPSLCKSIHEGGIGFDNLLSEISFVIVPSL